MINDLVRIHHENYLADIHFWHSITRGKDPVLELGCGHGRVTLPLCRAARQVVGVDLDLESLHYLLTASQPGAISKPGLLQADMLSLPFSTRFEAVIIPCNTYSIFNADQRILLLKKIVQILRPAGIFSFSIPNPYLIREYHQELSEVNGETEPDIELTFTHPTSGNPVQVSSHLSPLAGALSWEWIYDHLYPDGRVERHMQAAIHQLSSLDQYRIEIESAGFRNNSFLGDFDGSPYQHDSPYLIMVCSIS